MSILSRSNTFSGFPGSGSSGAGAPRAAAPAASPIPIPGAQAEMADAFQAAVSSSPEPESPPYNGRSRLLRRETYTQPFRTPDRGIPLTSVAERLRGDSQTRVPANPAALDRLENAWLGSRRAVASTVQQMARLMRGTDTDKWSDDLLTRVNVIYDRIENALVELPLSPDEKALSDALDHLWADPMTAQASKIQTVLDAVDRVTTGCGWDRLLCERPRHPILYPKALRCRMHLQIGENGRTRFNPSRRQADPTEIDPVPLFPDPPEIDLAAFI